MLENNYPDPFNLFCLDCARLVIQFYHDRYFEKTDSVLCNYIRDKVGELRSTVKVIDFQSMTKEQLYQLGFRPNIEGNMMAIPVWVWPFMKEGIEVYRLGIEPVPFSWMLDKDNRGGLSGFAFPLLNRSF